MFAAATACVSSTSLSLTAAFPSGCAAWVSARRCCGYRKPMRCCSTASAPVLHARLCLVRECVRSMWRCACTCTCGMYMCVRHVRVCMHVRHVCAWMCMCVRVRTPMFSSDSTGKNREWLGSNVAVWPCGRVHMVVVLPGPHCCQQPRQVAHAATVWTGASPASSQACKHVTSRRASTV